MTLDSIAVLIVTNYKQRASASPMLRTHMSHGGQILASIHRVGEHLASQAQWNVAYILAADVGQRRGRPAVIAGISLGRCPFSTDYPYAYDSPSSFSHDMSNLPDSWSESVSSVLRRCARRSKYVKKSRDAM